MKHIPFQVFARQLSLLAVMLVGFISVVAAPGRAAESDDNKAMAEMQQKLTTLRARMAAVETPLEQERLQKEAVKIVEETLPKLSPQSRALLQVGLKIMQPLQETSSRYLQLVDESMDSALGDFAEIKSRQTIQERIDKIKLLNTANQGILDRINRLESDVLTLLVESGVPEAARQGFVEGFMKASAQKIGPMKAIRSVESQLYAHFTTALRYLDTHWGRWSANEALEIAWKDASLEDNFLKIMKDIETAAGRQTQAEAALNKD